MATKTKKEETKVEELVEEILDDAVEETVVEEPDTKEPEPEKKETLWDKTKKVGGKIGRGVKKALPYVGAFAAGAGAAVGALVVLTRPDGTELEMLPQDDSLIPADNFIEGEGIVVEETDAE